MSLSNLNSLARVNNFKEHRMERIQAIDQPPNWQQEYKNSITSIEDLCQELGLKFEQLGVSSKAQRQFPLRVPRSYLARIKKSNPTDPLLLQVLPTTYEDKPVDGFLKDPVGDLDSIKTSGLLQKYNGRALLIVTSRCAIHCRYCFRRHFPYSEQNARQDNWEQAIEQLRNDKSINEVILSGGDPLVLDDDILSALVRKFDAIQHIKRLRIHTRLPVVIPNRINSNLLNWIEATRLQIIIVTHINHAQEIDSSLRQRLNKLKQINCTLLNQSVLLKNVNDSASCLVQLSDALFTAGILPYYLHLLDKVEGAAHFEVLEKQALLLMTEISSRLPGYLVPKLVKEEAGKPSKSLVFC